MNDDPLPANAPVPATDIGAELARADLIVAGTVTRVEDANAALSIVSAAADAQYDQLRQAEVTVLRVLKGKPAMQPLRVFFLQGQVPSRQWTELMPRQTALLFLRATQNGYAPVSPTLPALFAEPDLTLAPPGSSLAQALARELEQVISSMDPHANLMAFVQATEVRSQLQIGVDLAMLDTPAFQDPARRAAWVAIALAEGQDAARQYVEPLFRASVRPPPILQNLVLNALSELNARQ
jgi:hypothetical protein